MAERWSSKDILRMLLSPCICRNLPELERKTRWKRKRRMSWVMQRLMQNTCQWNVRFNVENILSFWFETKKNVRICPLTSHFVISVKIGLRHPDPVVETSSLSSVNPPDVWYRVSIPEEVTDRGCLSALQLEAITYAAQVDRVFFTF